MSSTRGRVAVASVLGLALAGAALVGAPPAATSATSVPPLAKSVANTSSLQVAAAPATASSIAVSPVAAKAREASPDNAVNQVLAISVDGLNPRAITQLGSSKAPAFYRLMRQGAWTFDARTERERTITLPNHTSMLTGRRIDKRHHGHGVTYDTDHGKTVHQAAGHYVASVFDVVHDRDGSTALFSAKTKFRLYSRTWNTKGRADTVGRNNGRAKIDRVVIDTDNARLVARLNAELRTRPRTFTFLHISLPDAAGHRYGFMSRQYVAAVQQTDRLLGTVLNTVAARPAVRKHLLVVLTADHGGYGPSHSDPTKLQDYRIPFMVWGPDVPAHRGLYTLNHSFRYPGTERTTYSGKQPIRNGDMANLVTDALDLPVVPGSTLDRPRKLDAFRR